MSWRHRHFSVRPARLANLARDESASAGSRDRHDPSFATLPHGLTSPRLAEADYRVRRRQWIVTVGSVPATIPMWASRNSWTCDVAAWAASSTGQRTLRRAHLTQRLFTRVSAALARFADGTSGRHCAVTNSRVALTAGCSARSVTTVRAVLAEAAFAVEVRRGTGSATTPVHQRRPSVWHLTSRRTPVDRPAFCDLPRSRREAGSAPLGSTQPGEALRAAPGDSSNPKRRRSGRHSPASPRPLHTQRLAGWLASTAAGLGARSGHHVVGQLCDALQTSHLELDAWTGPQLVSALNDDMKRRGITWPDEITHPGAFLAHRLRHLPARPPTSADKASMGVHGVPEEITPIPPTRPSGCPSQARVDAQRSIRETLARKRRASSHH